MADLSFNKFIAVRTTNWTAVRTWQQFESNLPKGWEIEPVSVGVEQNDTIIEEPLEVFKILIELSWIDKSEEEVLQDLRIEKYTNANGDLCFYDWAFIQPKEILYRFLSHYYADKWAFIKVGDREIYGKVYVEDRRYKMKTSKWKLIMPLIFVSSNNEKHYVFFPMKALLQDSERNLVNIVQNTVVQENDRHSIETQIISLLEKLAVISTPKTVVEINKVYERIEEACRNSGVIRKVSVESWKLKLDFGWRKATDTDREYSPFVLPPCQIIIDLANFTLRGNDEYHPHILYDKSLCLGWTLTDLAHRCVENRDLYSLVCGLIQFGNSWTSNDVGDSERHPAFCVQRYVENGWEHNRAEELEGTWITKEDITNTLAYEMSVEDLNSPSFLEFLGYN